MGGGRGGFGFSSGGPANSFSYKLTQTFPVFLRNFILRPGTESVTLLLNAVVVEEDIVLVFGLGVV